MGIKVKGRTATAITERETRNIVKTASNSATRLLLHPLESNRLYRPTQRRENEFYEGAYCVAEYWFAVPFSMPLLLN